ncbi:MAG: hypothetical protein SFV19_07550 [Rhodospirillaceae bacterium]|nr:hypothetical protein [Rhodospirillaceae bacterium]
MMTTQTPGLASGVLSFAALAALLVALILPGVALLTPTDRDEARFMQSAKQMVESGDYTRINFQNEPRDKKPIGAYWAQAAAARMLAGGDLTQAWPYRLPSMLAGVLAVLVTAWAARNVTAGVVMATTLLVLAEATLAKADGLLLAASAVVFAGALRAYTADTVSTGLKIAFWLALGAGVLIKGPILPGLLALTLLTLYVSDRSLAWMKNLSPAWGIVLALSVVAAWPLVSGWDEVTRFTVSAVGQDLLPKILGGMESHGAPPGTHTVLVLATLWPWSLMLPLTLAAAWRMRHRPDLRFCLTWIAPFWLALEIAPTKLPHYPLPVFPAFALLIAATTVKAWTPLRAATHGVAGIALIAAALLTAPRVFPVLPTYQQLILSERLAAALTSLRSPQQPVILVGYHEPSAVFLLGTETILTNPQDAAARVAADPKAILVIEQASLAMFDTHFSARNEKLARVAEVSGYNYGRGEAATLIVLKAVASGP